MRSAGAVVYAARSGPWLAIDSDPASDRLPSAHSMIRVTDTVSARLRRLATTDPLPAAGEVLQAGAHAIMAYAQHSILDGAVSGARHVPSKPGQPPNNDTGELVDSFYVGEVIETEGQVQTFVGNDAPYAGLLEHGTSKMAPRPFLGPATQLNRSHIIDALVAAKRKHEAS